MHNEKVSQSTCIFYITSKQRLVPLSSHFATRPGVTSRKRVPEADGDMSCV